MPPGCVRIIAAVPTSNTPQPHAQANAKPGVNALSIANESKRLRRPPEQQIPCVAKPRRLVNIFMMPSPETEAGKQCGRCVRKPSKGLRRAQRQIPVFKRGTVVRGEFVDEWVRRSRTFASPPAADPTDRRSLHRR